MRVLVLLFLALLRSSAQTRLCDGGLCACDRMRGKLICSCTSSHSKELVLNSTVVPEGTNHLRLENCARVRVKPHTWEGHRDIRAVELHNIGQLTIESNAFSWNETLYSDPHFHLGLSVNIFNSSIPEIPSFSFRGRLNNIILNNVTIGTVFAFAFASLYSTEKLELTNCIVKDFEAQAFKKFAVHKFHITAGHFLGVVPSRTMVDLEVHDDFVIDKLRVDTIRSSAIIIRKCKVFRIRDCYFEVMEGEAFRVKTRGRTLIQNNAFMSLAKGAFAHIGVEHSVLSREGVQELKFENNTIGEFEEGCLIFDASFEPQMDHILLNHVCSCPLLDSWSNQLALHLSEANPQQNKGKLSAHSDASNPANPFWCQKEENPKSKREYVRFYDYSQQCVISTGLYVFLIIIVTSALALLAVILLIIFWCRRRHSRNQRRWINVPTSPNSINNKSTKITSNKNNGVPKKSKDGQDPRFTMVVPDGRTYKETELHVIVERTEPLPEPDIVDTAINERSTKAEGDTTYIETHH